METSKTTGAIGGSSPVQPEKKHKQALSLSELDKKARESKAGVNKHPKKGKALNGPNFDVYSEQAEGDTTANAGVFK